MKAPTPLMRSPVRDHHEVVYAFRTQAAAKAFRDAVAGFEFAPVETPRSDELTRMTPALRQAIRSALDMPLLSERRCEAVYGAVYRAVLESIREPTETMVAAGVDAVWNENAQLPRAAQEVAMLFGFPAMIDAALQSAPPIGSSER